MDVHDEKRRVNVFLSSPEIAASVDHNSLPRCLFERVDEKKGKKIIKKDLKEGEEEKKERRRHTTHTVEVFAHCETDSWRNLF